MYSEVPGPYLVPLHDATQTLVSAYAPSVSSPPHCSALDLRKLEEYRYAVVELLLAVTQS
ncbi:hypothetical protein TMatcc_000757 [Talaromyces marneffei ATCC 18224]